MNITINFENFKRLLELEHQHFALCHQSISVSTDNGWERFLNEFVSDLQRSTTGKGLQVTSSIGKGKWAYIPWIRIAYPEISYSNTDGFFIGYEFGWEDHHAFISLLQGVDSLPESKQSKVLAERKVIIQRRVNGGSFTKTDLHWHPQIDGTPAKRKRGWSYAEAMIFHKSYNLTSLPAPEQLQADLQEAISIYEKIRELVVTEGLISGLK